MRVILLAAGVFSLLSIGTAAAKDREPAPPAAKSATIKDEEAVKCIRTRLEDQTNIKGWKIELKDLNGSARDFVATSGDHVEKGTVNVSKSYPNQGPFRVYVVPRD